MKTICIGSIVLLLASCPGCTRSQLMRGAYEAGLGYDCIQRTGSAGCDTTHPDHDTYRQSREAEIAPTAH